MPGDLALKTGTAVTVTTTGGSATNLSAVSAGDVDFRSGGTANLIEQMLAFAELKAQWSTVSGIAAGSLIADLYLVPKLDGTNAVDIDTTGGASFIPSTFRVGSFMAAKQPTSSTDARFATAVFELFPALYTAYIINRSGQTISANWTLKLLPAEGRYT